MKSVKIRLVLLVLMCRTLIVANEDQKVQKSTEKATEKATEKTTEQATEKATEKATEAPTDATTKGNNDKKETSNAEVSEIYDIISKIDKGAFYNLTLSEELDLSSNVLTAKTLLPELFEGHFSATKYEPLINLKILRLSYLHALDQDLFEHLSSLEVLSLDNNPILTIDHLTAIVISDIPNLKFLDLSYLELTEVPKHLFKYPHELNTLNLTGNLLTEISDALEYTVNLQTLYLDENNIEYIGYGKNVFPAMKKLEFLSVSYNTLKSIGAGAFSQLKALNTLMVTKNHHLSILHASALSRKGTEDPRRLEYLPLTNLYLHNNNLSTLDMNLFTRYENLDVIDIRHNPWVCDRENQWLISNLLPVIIKKHPTMSKDLICHQPTALVGIELTELLDKISKLRCSDKYNNMPQQDGTILVGILIGDDFNI